jgi:uncharacterized protein (TIGR02145 family)
MSADSGNVIAEIVRRFGEGALLDPQKLRGLISDLIPGESATRKRLGLAINEEVPQKLHGLKNKDEHERDLVMRNEASRLSETYDMAVETAHKIVNYFAAALGYKTIMVAFRDPRDGKFYKTVEIGNQVWMAENLNYAAKGSKCYKNKEAYGAKYGRLYDWETAKKACPAGWHLPSNAEWQTLVDFVGGKDIASKKLKSTSGWKNGGNGTDEYGFLALPGGFGSSDGSFGKAGNRGYWWSATEYYTNYAWIRSMGFYYEYVYRYNDFKTNLFSVRCVQD